MFNFESQVNPVIELQSEIFKTYFVNSKISDTIIIGVIKIDDNNNNNNNEAMECV